MSTPLTKSDYAYEELRARILDGRFPVGGRLRLREVASELGLSEMPIREAMRRLQVERLVQIDPHRNVTVAELQVNEVIAAIGVRMWNEILAVREATQSHDQATLEVAAQALERGAVALREDNPESFSVANHEFHIAVEAPASGTVRMIIDQLWVVSRQCRRNTSIFEVMPERMVGAHREHELLFESIIRGDSIGAGDCMADHRLATLNAWAEAGDSPAG